MKKNKDGFAFPAYGSGNRAGADGSKVKEKRFRYSCHYNVRHPGQCDGQSGYGVTKLDAIVESIVCTKFSEILECSKSKLLQDMLRKDMEVAQKEVSRAKSELDLKENQLFQEYEIQSDGLYPQRKGYFKTCHRTDDQHQR